MCPGPVGLPCINPRFCTYFPLSVLLYPSASVFLTFPVALGRILFSLFCCLFHFRKGHYTSIYFIHLIYLRTRYLTTGYNAIHTCRLPAEQEATHGCGSLSRCIAVAFY